jgi:hypothetical protein
VEPLQRAQNSIRDIAALSPAGERAREDLMSKQGEIPPRANVQTQWGGEECDIPQRVDDQSGWGKWSPPGERNIKDLTHGRGEIPQSVDT